MNYIKKLFTGGYEEIWKAIIRPPRDSYKDGDLGPQKFKIYDKMYRRNDFFIFNREGMKIHCSHWEPFDDERPFTKLPCVIYLHGNCSSRIEAFAETQILLPRQITLLAFDFTGCGRSDGEYVSLGLKEKYDVEAVVYYLIKSNKVTNIALWGRSMGSVTAFLFCEMVRNYNIISCVIADSPFSNLIVLLKELANDKIMLPSIVIDKLLKMVKLTIKESAGYDIGEIKPIESIKKLKLPIMFITGKNDDFVKSHHSHYLYEIYGGLKNFVMFEGDHNTIRPKSVRKELLEFLETHLEVNETYDYNELSKSKSMISRNTIIELTKSGQSGNYFKESYVKFMANYDTSVDSYNFANYDCSMDENLVEIKKIKLPKKKSAARHIHIRPKEADSSITVDEVFEGDEEESQDKCSQNTLTDDMEIEDEFSETQGKEIYKKLLEMSMKIKKL